MTACALEKRLRYRRSRLAILTPAQAEAFRTYATGLITDQQFDILMRLVVAENSVPAQRTGAS